MNYYFCGERSWVRGQDGNNISPNITCYLILTERVKYLKYLKLKWNWKENFSKSRKPNGKNVSIVHVTDIPHGENN